MCLMDDVPVKHLAVKSEARSEARYTCSCGYVESVQAVSVVPCVERR